MNPAAALISLGSDFQVIKKIKCAVSMIPHLLPTVTKPCGINPQREYYIENVNLI